MRKNRVERGPACESPDEISLLAIEKRLQTQFLKNDAEKRVNSAKRQNAFGWLLVERDISENQLTTIVSHAFDCAIAQ